MGVGAVAHHSFLFLRWSFGDTSFRARRLAESQKVEKHIFDVLSGVQWSKDARNKKKILVDLLSPRSIELFT